MAVPAIMQRLRSLFCHLEGVPKTLGFGFLGIAENPCYLGIPIGDIGDRHHLLPFRTEPGRENGSHFRLFSRTVPDPLG